MNNTTAVDELHHLLLETREHLLYLQELGVDLLELPSVTCEAHPAVSSSMPAARSLSPSSQVTGSAKPVSISAPSSAAKTLFEDFAPQPETLAKSAEDFETIWADVGNCKRCPLHEERTHIVHTEGNRNAGLMFVGEAPGADEDFQARPFVGKAGQLLTKIIESMGFKREEVLIGNVNRCRPPGNRAPTTEEAAMCKPFLLREIAVGQPKVIVVLGNTAMRNLLETREGITRMRGRFHDYKGIKVMPTYHPAYLLRDPAKKRETWEDLKKVRDYLDEIDRQSLPKKP